MMKNLNEHDMTKQMLDTMRGGKKLIKEETETSTAIDLTGPELQDEEKKFREAISPRVNFTGLKVYPQASNVVFSGKFQDMGGMEWQFTMSETNGVYIKANNLQLTKETVASIQKIFGYYQVWVKEWANKMATEYKQEQNM